MADVGPVSSFTLRSPVLLAGDRLYIDDGAGGDWCASLAILMASLTKVNNVTVTKPATGSTLTIADGKTLAANNTLTLAGTDGKTLTISNSLTLAGIDATTMTFPSTSATIARTDAAQTFTGVQTFSTPIATGSVATMTATVGGGVPTPPNNTTTFLRGDGTFAAPTGSAPGGSNTQIQYNNSSAFGGISAFTTDGTNLTLTSGNFNLTSAPLVISGNLSAATWGGAAISNITGVQIKSTAATLTDSTAATGTTVVSASSILGGNTIAATNTGVIFTTYYDAYFKVPVAGTHVTLTNPWALGADSFSTPGQIQTTKSYAVGTPAIRGVSANSGLSFSGTGTYFSAGGNSIASINTTGVVVSSTVGIGFAAGAADSGGNETAFFRLAAANMRQGLAPSATPIAQTFTIGEASIGGTSNNVGGANGTVQSGLGTGTGTLSSLVLQSPKAAASGTTAQTYVTGLTILAGTAVLTSYVVANLPSAATVGAGATAFVTDASTTLVLGLGGPVTGGGANKVPVYSDGTTWNYG